MIAAPLAATILGDYGAEVVKLEHPGRGDTARHFSTEKHEQGIFWKSLSRNKKSVALDLHTVEAQALLRRWLGTFDIFIENFRPGTLEKWNLDPNRLLEEHPQLIVLRTTAFGQSGPYRDRAGFGTLAEAMTGIAAVSGWEDRPPLLPPLALADTMAAMLGASAVLAAYIRMKQTGQGEIIDCAIYEAAMKLTELQLMAYDQTGHVPLRKGNELEFTSPRGAFLCSDGKYVALSGSSQTIAERFILAVGGEEMAKDPRFKTNADRIRNGDALNRAIEAWCKVRTQEEVLDTLIPMGCAIGPLETIPTVFDNPQIAHRESFLTVDDPVFGPMRMMRAIPEFLHSEPATIEPGPSELGGDTVVLLKRDLKLGDAEIAGLRERGIIPPEHARPPVEEPTFA
ncbi:MAG: CoA transferase [Candidatus Eremiobacteraeota bacterium]|nr:CoA transferase [Candidatus Eremiobacteraeota bacterium]